MLIIKQLTNLNHDFGFAELTKELMRGYESIFLPTAAFSKQQIVLEIIFIILSFSPLAEEKKKYVMRVTTQRHMTRESKYALECALIPTHTSLLEIFAYIDVYDFFATVPIIATNKLTMLFIYSKTGSHFSSKFNC